MSGSRVSLCDIQTFIKESKSGKKNLKTLHGRAQRRLQPSLNSVKQTNRTYMQRCTDTSALVLVSVMAPYWYWYIFLLLTQLQILVVMVKTVLNQQPNTAQQSIGGPHF